MSDSDTDNEWDHWEWQNPIIKQWSREGDLFVRTKAFKIIAEKIQTHDRILITGKTGSGKSAIARHIALTYATDGRDVSYIKALDEIEDNLPQKVGTGVDLFVIDDPIGKSSLDLLACRWWQTQKKRLDHFLRLGIKGRKLAPHIRVLVTCRQNLIDDETMQFFENYCIVNIDEDTLAPTPEERRQIFESHVDTSSISDQDMQTLLETPHAFPALCHTVGKNRHFQRNTCIGQFFQSPYKFIQNELVQLKKTSKDKYMGLFLLVIGDGEVNEDSFLSDCSLQSEDDTGEKYESLTSIQNGSIVNLLNVFGLPQNTTAQSLIESLNGLTGEFLTCVGGIYRFHNNVLYQACLHYYCTEEPKLFLEYCNGSFFRNYVAIQVKDEKDMDYLFPRLNLQENFIKDYAKRIADDICDGTFLDVFLCPWTSDKRITMVLETILRSKNPNELLTLTLEPKLAKDVLGLSPLVKKERLNLQGFSEIDLVTYGETVSPIVLSLIFNHNEIFHAMFELLKEDQVCCASLRKQPLLAAVCANGSVKLARLIIELYGDDERNFTWNTSGKIHAVHVAANFHHTDILSLLLSQENVNIMTSLEEAPLYLALLVQRLYILPQSIPLTEKQHEDERLETISLLIQNGASVNSYPSPDDNSSPLALACKGNNNVAAQLLLENGAKVNEANTRVRNGLHFASMHGNTDIVKLLISKGAEMNYCLKNKESALYYAARNGHSQVVEILLANGAEKELQDFRWNSPFYIACRNGHVNLVNRFLEYSKEFFENLDSDTAPSLQAAIESGNDAIVELLLQNRANVESMLKTSEKDLLCLAAELGHVRIVQLLLERKADVDAEEEERGYTPLIYASMFGHVLTARCLLENGADINKCDVSGKSPLFYAARYGHLDIVQLLLNHNAKTCLRACTGEDALFMAALWGHFDVTKELLKHKIVEIHDELINQEKKEDIEVDNDSQSGEGETSRRIPLFGAIRHGHRKIVELLISDGAGVDEAVDDDLTPLIIAAQGGHVEILKILIQRGASVNLSNFENYSPLHFACFHDNIDVVDTLLKSGSDIDATQTDGYTPLHLAVMNGRRKTALFLLEHDLNVNEIAIDQSALTLACEYNAIEVVSKLLSKGAQVNPEPNKPLSPSPLHIAARNGALKIAEVLLRHGAIVHLKSLAGKTPLFYATQSDHSAVVKLLLQNNARVNDQDGYGCTCLHHSINLHKHDEILSLFLQNRSTDVNICNKDGTSPLMMAVSGKQGVSVSRVRRLIEHGADVNAHDNQGTTALHRAVNQGEGSIVELLLNHGAKVDQTNDEGESALFIATKHGQEAAVRALLQGNANTGLLTKSGESPLDVARREGLESLVRLLTDKSETKAADNEIDPSAKTEERKLVMVRTFPLGPALPRKRSPYKIPVRR